MDKKQREDLTLLAKYMAALRPSAELAVQTIGVLEKQGLSVPPMESSPSTLMALLFHSTVLTAAVAAMQADVDRLTEEVARLTIIVMGGEE